MKQYFIYWSATLLIAFACSPDKHTAATYSVFPSKVDSIYAMQNLLYTMQLEIPGALMYTPSYPTATACFPQLPVSIKYVFARKKWYSQKPEGQPDSACIQKHVLEYYTKNFEANSMHNWDPVYFVKTPEMLEAEIRLYRELIAQCPDSMSQRRYQKVLEINLRQKRAIKTLRQKEVRFPDENAYVVILTNGANPPSKSAVIDSVLTAYYILRDRAARTYFKRSYVDLFYNRLNETSNRRKLEALEVLFPVHIKDHTLFKHLNPHYYESICETLTPDL